MTGVTKWRVWFAPATVIAGSEDEAADVAERETGHRPSRVVELSVVEHVCRCGHLDHHEVDAGLSGAIETVTVCEVCQEPTVFEVGS